MEKGLGLAAAGARAQSEALDVVASNLANAGTAGFRAQRVSFREALDTASAQGASVVGATTAVDSTAGALRRTDNPLDLALSRDGYLAIDTPGGVRYTRAGGLELDPTGALATADGSLVRGRGGAHIQIPPGAARIEVTEEGAVRADGAEVGTLELVRFAPDALTQEGGGRFAVVPGGAPLTGEGPRVESGVVEQSNVNPVRGVMDLVRITRTYEALHRMIEMYGQLDKRVAQEMGKPR